MAENINQVPVADEADLNMDGVVNILDLVLVGRNFGQTYGP